jgi:signal transduction histidine kinase
VPVWNALCDTYHPTQVLADLLTVREVFGRIRGVRLAYVGDGRNNLARSLMIGAAKMGVDLRILAPPELSPSRELVKELMNEAAVGAHIRVTREPREALEGCDAVYNDVWVSMGEEHLVAERVALLRPVHPDAACRLELDDRRPLAYVSADLLKGILTNLLQNAAEAAGPRGTIVALTRADDHRVVVEVHDSGPGLSDEAAATLFEPTITFKKDGMGLGLSIARKNALLSGGDIVLVHGRLGGAAFRVTLPAAAPPAREQSA